ncbi:MAG: Rid family hydrolase [Anaerolineales bacterium]|jgi:2-iminobutanoate/2-iminopropanoate deaminase
MEHHTLPNTSIPTAYGAYSHAVVAGDYVFLSGQTGRDPQTGRVIEGDIGAQTRRTLEIVREILGQLGLSLSDVVRSTVYLASIDDYAAMNGVYSAMVQPPYPARSVVQVNMPYGALVGMEVMAYRKGIGDNQPEAGEV